MQPKQCHPKITAYRQVSGHLTQQSAPACRAVHRLRLPQLQQFGGAVGNRATLPYSATPSARPGGGSYIRVRIHESVGELADGPSRGGARHAVT